MNKTRFLRVTVLFLTLLFSFSLAVFAECDHEWELLSEDYHTFSDDQHNHYKNYYCSKCGDSKTETILENHNWKLDGSYVDSSSDTQHIVTTGYECDQCNDYKEINTTENHALKSVYKYYDQYSASQHSFREEMCCSICDKYITRKGIESHTFDKYHNCKYCGTVVGRTITLKPNKTAFVNEKTWIKISIPKTGYIKVHTTTKEYYGVWSLYNKSKTVFQDSRYLFFNCGIS